MLNEKRVKLFKKLFEPALTSLIITHGVLLRLFLMRWFHWSVEEFENLKNPKNCQIVVMEKQDDDSFKLISELERKRDCRLSIVDCQLSIHQSSIVNHQSSIINHQSLTQSNKMGS
ncbi:MAG: histidine phosphatase family protein [Desulfobacterales bacterium]|nr:histidine phosphatase family protein [Desulfobacterales bacterium]